MPSTICWLVLSSDHLNVAINNLKEKIILGILIKIPQISALHFELINKKKNRRCVRKNHHCFAPVDYFSLPL